MKDLNEVLQAVRDQISANINTYLPSTLHLTDDCVVVDYPDMDSMKHPNMIFVVPETESISPQTICMDISSFGVRLYIICRRDTTANLTHKAIEYYEAVGKVVQHDKTLGGAVDMCQIDTGDFYPAQKDTGYAGVDVNMTTNRNVFR